MFDGVTVMHLITVDGNGGAPLQTGPEIVKLATSAGVGRVTVLWSGEEGPVEQAVEGSELEWTLLRPTVEYMSNMLAWAESIRAEGLVEEPFGGRLDAAIDEADIGAVAATALLEDGHAGKRYTLTGPEVLTVPDKVQAIGAVIGRDIQFVELSENQARERMRKRPAWLSAVASRLFMIWAMVGMKAETSWSLRPLVATAFTSRAAATR